MRISKIKLSLIALFFLLTSCSLLNYENAKQVKNDNYYRQRAIDDSGKYEINSGGTYRGIKMYSKVDDSFVFGHHNEKNGTDVYIYKHKDSIFNKVTASVSPTGVIVSIDFIKLFKDSSERDEFFLHLLPLLKKNINYRVSETVTIFIQVGF